MYTDMERLEMKVRQGSRLDQAVVAQVHPTLGEVVGQAGETWASL